MTVQLCSFIPSPLPSQLLQARILSVAMSFTAIGSQLLPLPTPPPSHLFQSLLYLAVRVTLSLENAETTTSLPILTCDNLQLSNKED